ncbi:hypothetical protein ACFVZC_29885 [Streptomyces marokkonensis]|uniref:Integral-membrane protein n=1 Tax=Streptomyces marokkonensis TaxID=324855 RepID=A0ABW6QFR9_9ACTN
MTPDVLSLSRAVRAVAFGAVCVTLAATGHILMSGEAVPGRAMVAAFMGTVVGAWALAGRERGPLAVTAMTVTAQAALHAGFSLAQTLTRADAQAGASFVRRWAEHLLCVGMPPHTPERTATGMPGHAHATAHDMSAAGTAAHGAHDMSAMAPLGMAAAHVAAAMLCGVWLAYGERAVFRVLRALAGWLAAPLRRASLRTAPPRCAHPRVRPRRDNPVPRRTLPAVGDPTRGPPGAHRCPVVTAGSPDARRRFPTGAGIGAPFGAPEAPASRPARAPPDFT